MTSKPQSPALDAKSSCSRSTARASSADVVTGKLDVREAAAHLPDESDDQNLIQETDSSIHDSDEDFYAANVSEDKMPIEAPI